MTTTDPTAFTNVLADTAELTDLYRAPSPVVLSKAIDHLDDGCRSFIARSTFVAVGTAGAGGALDVSPRGGPIGFVKVLDDHRLAIPDLNGNNRLDSLRNVIETGAVGLMFIVPGLGETLRINGTAVVTTDPAVLDRFTDDLRRPVSAIGVTVTEAYVHCAKAFRRGGIWDPASWPARESRPSPGAILLGHTGIEGVTAEQVDENLEAGYVEGLAYDKPTPVVCDG